MKQMTLDEVRRLTESKIDLQIIPHVHLIWKGFAISSATQVQDLASCYRFRVRVMDEERVAFYAGEEPSEEAPQIYSHIYQWFFLPVIETEDLKFTCSIFLSAKRFEVLVSGAQKRIMMTHYGLEYLAHNF